MSGQQTDTVSPGSVQDMVARIRAVLPFAWFPAGSSADVPSQAPVLDSVLSGIGTAWAFCFNLLQYVQSQARLATISGCFLDLFAADFFGSTIRRRVAETDDAFRVRLKANLLIPRATRAALADTLLQLTGVSAWIFEPRRSGDTGGFGAALLGYGTSNTGFQYLTRIDANGGPIRRESEASYIDAGGRLRIAPRHAARPIYVGGVWQAFLVEAAGYNLLKDSAGWGGWSLPLPGATAGWNVDQRPAISFWLGQAVMQIDINATGPFNGPSTTVFIGNQAVCASAWVFIPSQNTLTNLELSFGDEALPAVAAADLTIVDQWQRLVVPIDSISGQARDSVVRLSGTSTGLMVRPVITQCWQVEPGSLATSYIPSSGQIGVRDMDRMDASLSTGGNPVVLNGDDIDEAIARTIPAGSVAWLALQHTQ